MDFSIFNSFRPVGNSPDLERILALPRRPGDVEEWLDDDLVEYLSSLVRRPGAEDFRLFPIQAGALIDLTEQGGGLGPIGVGEGKTIISLLLPVMMKSKVAVIMVPPSLKSKLIDVEYPDLQKKLRLPALAGYPVRFGDEEGTIHVVSYSQLSSQSGAQILEQIRPDLIVCDEAHALKDMSAARTKRFFRYLRVNRQVRVVFLSGTLTSRSIKDFAHLSNAALKEGSPTPLSFPVIQEWAGALDARDEDERTPPGQLRRLCEREDEDVLVAYQRRLRETPGVVASGARIIPNGIIIQERKLTTPPEVEEALETLRKMNETPSGEELVYSLDVHRAGLQLSAGMYSRWIWPRGEPAEIIREWREARSVWRREKREYLKHRAREHMDSPGFLESAAKRWYNGYTHDEKDYPALSLNGPLPVWAAASYPRWADIEDKAEPQTEYVWISDFMVKDAVKFGKQAPCIIWYEHRDLGRRIAAEGGFRLFGEGEEASRELPALASSSGAGKETIVCSVQAHHKGHNLQAWHKMLVTTWPSSGSTIEQLIGRAHREGQKEDDVLIWTYQHTPEVRKCFRDSQTRAKYIQTITGSAQRLCRATVTFDYPA